MNRIEALEILNTRAWSMWKPAERNFYTNEESCAPEFKGIQLMCTKSEWYDILFALGDESHE
jgi:hypothetical protein